MNRKARRALKSDVQWSKLTLTGRYDEVRTQLSDEALAVLISALRIAVNDLDRISWTDRDLYDSHVELIGSGLLEVFVAFRPAGLAVRTVVTMPDHDSLVGYWNARHGQEAVQ